MYRYGTQASTQVYYTGAFITTIIVYPFIIAISDTTSDNPAQLEASQYLKEHHIPELFEQLTAGLVYARPDDPRLFIKEHLEQLKKNKDDPELNVPPSLFDESNLNSVFRMLDVPGKGYITHTQYSEAMKCVGITHYNHSPAGAEMNKISRDTFLREAKAGLNLAVQTYSVD